MIPSSRVDLKFVILHHYLSLKKFIYYLCVYLDTLFLGKRSNKKK